MNYEDSDPNAFFMAISKGIVVLCVLILFAFGYMLMFAGTEDIINAAWMLSVIPAIFMTMYFSSLLDID